MISWQWLDFPSENEMREYNKNDIVMVSGRDLNKIIAITRTLMNLKPNLNASLMDFYCYLNELKPNHFNESMGKSMPNMKRITVQESEGIDMCLDEMIWNLGMNLPSWDNSKSNDRNDSMNDNGRS